MDGMDLCGVLRVRKWGFILVLVTPIVSAAVVMGVNYLSLGVPLSRILAADPRNEGISARAHYGYYLLPDTVVFDLRTVSPTSKPVDIFRVLLQYSVELKSKHFERVELAHRGVVKFVLKGTYFETLGVEHGTQNPVYTMRTFPENVYRPDGAPAFGRWTGGLLGVVKEQFSDFNTFHMEWYIADLGRTGS